MPFPLDLGASQDNPLANPFWAKAKFSPPILGGTGCPFPQDAQILFLFLLKKIKGSGL